MDLPQIWSVRIFPHVMDMLYRLAEMGVALDAETLDQADRKRIRLAERMAFATADAGDDRVHLLPRASHQSALMSAALMSGHHFAISVLW